MECVIRILAAPPGRLLHQFVARLTAVRRIDLGEADAQTAGSGKQHREIGGIDLGEIPQDVNQPAQAPGDGKIHSFPHDRLRLRIVFHVSAVVQNLDQADPGRIELLDRAHGVVVVALVHLVALERRPNEDRDDELLLLPRDLCEGKHRAGASALSSRAHEDDDRILLNSASTSPRDSFSAWRATSGSCLAPRRPVV